MKTINRYAYYLSFIITYPMNDNHNTIIYIYIYFLYLYMVVTTDIIGSTSLKTIKKEKQ